MILFFWPFIAAQAWLSFMTPRMTRAEVIYLVDVTKNFYPNNKKSIIFNPKNVKKL